MHAKRMTDCTYLAQAQMEQLHALPWTSSSTASSLVVLEWIPQLVAYFEHPSGGAQPPTGLLGIIPQPITRLDQERTSQLGH